MRGYFEGLYTKAQMVALFRAWCCTEPLPTARQKTVICFAGVPHDSWELDLICVEKTALPATYGGRLYRVTMSSPAARKGLLP